MNIQNSVLNYVRYKQLNYYDQVKQLIKKHYREKFLNDTHLEEEKRETSKFLDAGSNNLNERVGN